MRQLESIRVSLNATAGQDEQTIFPHGFYLDTTTDEIWVGSGIIRSITMESDGTANWRLRIYDAIDGNGRLIRKFVTGGATFAGLKGTYGAHASHTTIPSELNNLGLKYDHTLIADTHLDDLDIACPHGMVVHLTAATPQADKISIIYEGMTAGYARYRNRNKPAPVNL